MFADVDFFFFFFFFGFIFKENHFLVEEGNPSEKNCDSQGRTRWYWYRWYRGNPKVFTDGEELTININEKKKTDVLQAYRCPLCDKCSRRQYFFNNHVDYCESVK